MIKIKIIIGIKIAIKVFITYIINLIYEFRMTHNRMHTIKTAGVAQSV
jgi:hypothetical protein